MLEPSDTKREEEKEKQVYPLEEEEECKEVESHKEEEVEERECYICTLPSGSNATSTTVGCLPTKRKANKDRKERRLLSVCNCRDRWIHLSCQTKLVRQYGKEKCDVCLADFRNVKRVRTMVPFLLFWSISVWTVLVFLACVIGGVLLTFELSFNFFPSLLLTCFGVSQLAVLKLFLPPVERSSSLYSTRMVLLSGKEFTVERRDERDTTQSV